MRRVSPGNRNPLEGDPNDAAASPEPCHMGVQISCGFHPKYRKKAIFGVIKKRLGDVFHELARRRESKIEEGHLIPDHVHMLISIPPKYSVAEVIGFMKGKSSIWIAQNVERKARNFTGHKFWARGYFVSTVGRDEEMIRAYIKNQEMQDRELDQLSMIP